MFNKFRTDVKLFLEAEDCMQMSPSPNSGRLPVDMIKKRNFYEKNLIFQLPWQPCYIPRVDNMPGNGWRGTKGKRGKQKQ